jgi:integrase
MYNEFQKKRYLKYCSDTYEPMTIGLIERIFTSTEVAENQYEKDVCDFNPIEVVDFLKGLNSKSRRRLQSTCIRLSKYYEWCKNVEHLTSNIINPFDSRGIDIVIDGILPKEDLNKKYFTKIQYLEMLNEIADVSNKFISYAFYSGLSFEELVNLKTGDLDFEHNIVHLINGRDLKVDTMFKHFMIETSDQTQYFADGIEKESRSKAYDYAESEYVIRTCSKNMAEPASQSYITTRMKVIKEQMGNEFISITTLYKNGMINYIKEQFAKKDIDLNTAFLLPIDGKRYVYDKETQQYISEFGSKMTVRFLRMEVKDYLDLL